MLHGVWMAQTVEGMLPAELAQLAEGLGFESLWFMDHTHIPVESSAFPEGFPEGEEMPPEYSQVMDPLIALTAAAGATSALRLGTAVCLMTERDPIVTAKGVASLDQLSGGRFLFGVGAGWNEPEMINHGTDPTRRLTVMRERVLAMKEIWTSSEASFHGEFVEFDRIKSEPKPKQLPHPPVMVGGNGRTAEKRAIEYGDEWMPELTADVLERISAFPERVSAAGREPIPVSLFGARPEDVQQYAEHGIHRCVYWLPANDADATRQAIAEIAREVGLG